MKKALIVLAVVLVAAGVGVVGYRQVVQAQGAGDQTVPWIGAEVRTWPSGGAQVVLVIADSPAQQGGLKAGDIVTAAAGQPVQTAAELVKAVRDSTVGSRLTLKVTRGSATLDVAVTVGERPKLPSPPGTLSGILEGVGRSEIFQRFLGGTLSLLDKDGNVVTLETTAGTVVSVSSSSLTLKPNNTALNEKTYDVSAISANVSRLKEGVAVVVITRQGDNKALQVLPARGVAGFLGGGLGKLHQLGPGMRGGMQRFFQGAPQGSGFQAPQTPSSAPALSTM